MHVAAATVGLSALLASSATAFTVVKLVGAAYLIVLGDPPDPARADDEAGTPRRARAAARLFLQGVVVNVLNPKTALFFLAFLPQFVDPHRGPVALQVACLGCMFVAIAVVSDSAYALPPARSPGGCAQRARRRIQRYVSGGDLRRARRDRRGRAAR